MMQRAKKLTSLVILTLFSISILFFVPGEGEGFFLKLLVEYYVFGKIF